MANKIIGTGLSGLVGSRVVELLPQYSFQNISRMNGVDITNEHQVETAIASSDAPIILHMAAYTNVDGGELQKKLGKDSEAWKINVNGTKNVVNAAKTTGKKLIYISTDFVFDGEDTPRDGYKETDIPHPINWYATTKYEAEKIVQKATIPWVIVRIAYPYRAKFEKNDFMRAIKSRLEQKTAIRVVKDHLFCPTFIDDIAYGLDTIIKNNTMGIFHITGSQSLSPSDAACMIAKIFELDKKLITPTTRAEYFEGKAPRPFNLSMNNGKIRALGVAMHTFEAGLEEIKKQL